MKFPEWDPPEGNDGIEVCPGSLHPTVREVSIARSAAVDLSTGWLTATPLPPRLTRPQHYRLQRGAS